MAAKVPLISNLVSDAASSGGKPLIPLVVYDLPDRDCAALASNGEYTIANNGSALYRAYIDAINQQLTAAASTNFVLVIGMKGLIQNQRPSLLTLALQSLTVSQIS